MMPNLDHPHLTPREKEILVISAKGYSVKEVCRLIGMCEGTAGEHLKTIYRKLGVRTKVEAAVWAAKEGWV